MSSDITWTVGSGSDPATVTRARAAAVSSARAANSGLSWRATARTLSSVAPGSSPPPGARCAVLVWAWPGPARIASVRPRARAAPGHRPAPSGGAAAPRVGRAISLGRVEGDRGAHRLGLALDLGRQRQRPAPGHAGLHPEAVGAGLLARLRCNGTGHGRHARGCHISPGLEDDRVRHRPAVPHTDEADGDVGLARPGGPGAGQLEPVVAGRGESNGAA